jgi:hypothetical protein
MANEFEIRNPVYNRHGDIDLEWNHPVHGWIAFTAQHDDVEEHGRLIHAQALAAGNIADYVPDPQAEAWRASMRALQEMPPIEDRMAALEARVAALEEKK